MKRLIVVAALAFGLAACKQEQAAAGNHGTPKVEDAAKEVADCFEGYKTAVLAQNGEAAADLLSQSTIDQYQKYVDLALTAERQELEALSLINRMQVILMRHRVPAETIRELNGKTAIVYAVDRDWIGKDSVIRAKIGEVSVRDNRATAEVIVGGNKAPSRFEFRRENGAWKFDLLSLLNIANIAMKGAAAQSGMDEDEFLFMLTESATGKKVDENIWSPLN